MWLCDVTGQVSGRGHIGFSVGKFIYFNVFLFSKREKQQINQLISYIILSYKHTESKNFFISKPFPKQPILNSSKLEDFADDNFKFDENGWKFSERIENTGEKKKLLVTSNFFFSHSVFKRLVLQTRKNQALFGKGLI